MLKVLFIKQLRELWSDIYIDRRTSKAKSKKAIMMMLLLYVMIAVSFGNLFLMYYGELAKAFVNGTYDWLYFALSSLSVFSLWVVLSLFMTYSGFYKVKDNDILLALPLSHREIVASRLMGIYVTNSFYGLLMWIPVMACYWFVAGFSLISLLCGILMYLALSFTGLFVSCFLGFLIVSISAFFKNNNLLLIALYLAGFGAYIYVVTNIQGIIAYLVTNQVALGLAFKNQYFLVYFIARACLDKPLWALAALGCGLLLLLLVVYLLGNNFHKLVSIGEKRIVNKVIVRSRERGVFSTLLHRELAHFFALPGYVLNCGLGVVFALIMAVMMVLKKGELLSFLALMGWGQHLNALALAALLLILAVDQICAASFSLEGRNYWLIRSLPLDFKMIFMSKIALAIVIHVPAVLAFGVALLLVGSFDWLSSLLAMLIILGFLYVVNAVALLFDLRFINLNWTNEMVVIKRNLSVLVGMLLGWLLAFLLGYGSLYLSLGNELYLLLWLLVIGVLAGVLTVFGLRYGEGLFAKA